MTVSGGTGDYSIYNGTYIFDNSSLCSSTSTSGYVQNISFSDPTKFFSVFFLWDDNMCSPAKYEVQFFQHNSTGQSLTLIHNSRSYSGDGYPTKIPPIGNNWSLTSCITNGNSSGTAPAVFIDGGNVTTTLTSCVGLSDGTAKVVPFSGSNGSPYSYAWAGSASGSTSGQSGGYTIFNLAPGTYTVTTTDGSSSTAVESFRIGAAGFICQTATTKTSCSSASDGSATITPFGSSSTYDYAWSGTSSGSASGISGDYTIPNLAAGSYSVTTSFGSSCATTCSFSITSDVFACTTSSTNTPSSTNVGTATAVHNAGTGYSYQWSNGGTTKTIANLGVGTYHVTVTNPSLCTSTCSATVGAGLPASVDFWVETSCGNAIQLTSTSSFSNQTAFRYTYFQNNTSLPNPYYIRLYYNGTNTFLYFYNYATQGRHYLYKPNNQAPNAIITVSDPSGNGWISSSQTNCNLTYFSTQRPNTPTCTLSASLSSQSDVSCKGLSNGSATITPTNGISSYTYSWSGTATGSVTSQSGAFTIPNLASGQYVVSVTDGASCMTTTSITISESIEALTVYFRPSVKGNHNISVRGGSDGSFRTFMAGGVSPYTYSWRGPSAASGPNPTGLKAGKYFLKVTDANGCKGEGGPFNLIEP